MSSTGIPKPALFKLAFIALAASLLLAAGCQATSPNLSAAADDPQYEEDLRQSGKQAREQAPAFSAKLLGTKKEIELADYVGKPVVVNFWASWCKPCRAEMPELIKVARDYEKKGVVFIGVNNRDIEKEALEFADEFNIPYDSIFDPAGRVTGLFRVGAIPQTILINEDGFIVFRFFGPVPEKTLRQLIEDNLL